MQKFFRNAGLTPTKSQACAEEAICQEAHNPRKLFKYVHEVADFSLMNLGKIVVRTVECRVGWFRPCVCVTRFATLTSNRVNSFYNSSCRRVSLAHQTLCIVT